MGATCPIRTTISCASAALANRDHTKAPTANLSTRDTKFNAVNTTVARIRNTQNATDSAGFTAEPGDWQYLFSCLSETRYTAEEPYFKIIRELDTDIAIRDYPAYVVAEVGVPGPADKAGNQAFPILAGYISGRTKAIARWR
jgi:hypothetical protein